MSTLSIWRQALFPLEYAAIRGAVGAFQSLPIETGMRCAERIGDLIYTFDSRHRRVAHENIAATFPLMDEAEVASLARRCFRSMSRAALEFVYTPRVSTPERWREHFDFPQLEWFRDFVSRGPVVFATAHLGNWEAVGIVLGHLGIETHAIARRLDNPLLNRWCHQIRECRRQHIVYKRGAVKAMSDLLRSGAKLAFLIDQNAGRKGEFCEFLGRKASTTPLPATLAQRIGAPILPGFALRTGKGFHFKVELYDPIDPADYAHLPAREAVAQMTAAATRCVESAVRRYPEQWNWMHRRWKTRPPEEPTRGDHVMIPRGGALASAPAERVG